jgi:light-regulated signal transduction histidine kinase (bacteriophytochrome)
VRTPFSHGFLFNVQPQLKVLDKSNQMEKLLGEGRMKLFDRMVGGKTSEKGLGKKQNPRLVRTHSFLRSH